MAFTEWTKMQRRQKMVEQVLGQGMSISAAARAAGVSRQSASLWVARAREQGIAHLSEASRRPHRVRPGVSPEVERQVLLFQSQHPAWGAKKLHAGLWPPEAQQAPPLCARTVGRILQRAGLRAQPPVSSRSGACQNFERLHCNALWQLDFKGLELSHAFRPLSILDDASRYCIALMAVARPRGRSVGQTADELLWEKLWSAFACYGLPEAILCDNGDGFNGNAGVGLTPFEMRLARLGIRVLHGRAYHPQTQGKIERFHRTLEAEWPHLLRVLFEQAPDALEEVRQSYNWLRPHEALGQRKPGSLYTPSARARPDNLPPAGIAANAVTRKVDGDGFISFRGNSYRMGRGLCGERVEIRGEHGADGELNHTAFYSGQRLDTLENIGAKGRNRIQTTPPKSVNDVLS